MPPGSSARPSTRRSARKRIGSSVLRKSSCQTPQPGPKRQFVEVGQGIFPALDDTTAGLVLSFMPCRDFASGVLVSKAWRALNSDESFWRPFLSEVDPVSTLGKDRVKELSASFSCKQVVSELSSRLCCLCREPTNGFFVLTCTRVCISCFQTDERVKMCSLSYAKSHYLLSKPQQAKLPTLCVENAEETGCQFSREGAMTVTTCSAAKASAVARWGSEEAFETVLRQRKAKAETSYEARRQAYAAQQAQQAHAPALTVATDTTGRDYAIDHGHQHATPASRRPCPTYPRILNLGKETNYVGVNQQQFHAVTGEKYGYFTVVNDGFFDSGPKLVIGCKTTSACRVQGSRGKAGAGGSNDPKTENKIFIDEPDCDGCAGCSDFRNDDYELSRQTRGKHLVETLQNVKAGTTVEIAAPVLIDATLCIRTSVRLVGSATGEIEMGNGTLVIDAPSIVRNLRVSRLQDVLHDSEDSQLEGSFGLPDIVGPAAHVYDDVLLEGCTFGPCPVGQAVMLQLGRLVIQGCTFCDVVYGVVVVPFTNTAHLATTLHLERNRFLSCWTWGIMRGPARCHLQDNDAVFAANTFSGFLTLRDAIAEYIG